MADVQIHPTGVVSAPGDYVIPDSAELALKNAFATFDGSGAASSFKPLLRIKSDAGTTLVEAVADTEVAAGASADASWFPNVGGGGGGGVTNAEWFYAVRSTSLTMLAGEENTIPWSSLHSSDSSLFSLGQNVRANDAVVVARSGVLLVSSYLIPSPLGTDFVVGLLNSDLSWGTIGEDTWTPEVVWNRDGIASNVERFGPRDISLTATASVPDMLTARFHNFDAANRVLAGAQLGGFWWPTSTPIS